MTLSLRGVAGVRSRAMAWGLVGLVRIYQWTLSPIIGRQCRFQPTCSHYMIGAVEKYGPIRGAWRGLKRICRSHPWHPGGEDPPRATRRDSRWTGYSSITSVSLDDARLLTFPSNRLVSSWISSLV